MSKELEEALNGLASYIMYTDDNSDESASAIEWHNTIKKALTQQQIKDERAKKVEELLELYREMEFTSRNPAFITEQDHKIKRLKMGDIWLQIKALEKELEEMK